MSFTEQGIKKVVELKIKTSRSDSKNLSDQFVTETRDVKKNKRNKKNIKILRKIKKLSVLWR
jgi:hypothetical protein